MKYFLALFFVTLPLGVHAHDIYTHWKTKEGMSCCNNSDCAPYPSRTNNGNVEFLVNGVWHVASPGTRLPFESPDSQNHACFFGGKIQCWTLGTGT